MDASLSVKITPLFDRVLVLRDPPRAKSGAIFLPEAGVRALERRSWDGNPATVIAVGPGGWRDVVRNGKTVVVYKPTPTLKPGDRVLLGFHPGPAVADPDGKGRDFNMPFAEDIRAIIEEE